MDKILFRGACTALVTPFLEGKVNYAMLERLLTYQLKSGIRTIVLCGTTGEASTLSDSEKLEIFQRARAFVEDRCLLLAGTGSNCTQRTVAMSVAAEQAGMDGLLVVSPYYNKATDEGIYQHYRSVAEAVHIPLVVYNVPSRTGLDIPVSVYKKLSLIPNIAGVKEASGDISKITGILSACGPDFGVWTGNDAHTVAAIALGAGGVISVTANAVPLAVNTMTEAALDGDMDTATAMNLRLHRLNELMFCQVNPIPIKAAMKMMGFDCGGCRLPLTDLDERYQNALRDALADCVKGQLML